jgi:multiple sugar transport system substrate-binding protein
MKEVVSRREFLRWATAAGAGAVLAACAPKPTTAPEAAPTQPTAEEELPTAAPATQAVTVSWWNPDVLDWQPSYQGIADLVMQKYPDVKVEVGNPAEAGFVEKVTAAIAAGTAPDVWTWYYATDTARHGFLQEVDAFIEADGFDPTKLWFPICHLRSMYQGKRYGTPRDGVWTAVMYNKALFDEFGVDYPKPGWTLDDYLAKAKALTSEEKGTWGTVAGGPGSLSWDVGFCWNMGFEIVSEDGRQVKGLLDSEESIWAIQWMIDLLVTHKVSPQAEIMESLGGEDYAFNSGKVGMGVGNGWILADMRELPFPIDQEEAPVKPGKTPQAWGDSVQYYMWTESKQKDAAWKVMVTASGVEGSKIAMENGAWTSPCPDTWLALQADKDPILGKWWIEAQKPTKIPNYLRTEYEWDCVWPEFEGIWTRYIENGERPLERLVQEAAENAQKCLDERYAENP